MYESASSGMPPPARSDHPRLRAALLTFDSRPVCGAAVKSLARISVLDELLPKSRHSMKRARSAPEASTERLSGAYQAITSPAKQLLNRNLTLMGWMLGSLLLSKQTEACRALQLFYLGCRCCAEAPPCAVHPIPPGSVLPDCALRKSTLATMVAKHRQAYVCRLLPFGPLRSVAPPPSRVWRSADPPY